MNCYDCPRECGIDRSKESGFCGEKNKIRVSKVIENFMWEEPCISGDKGALAIFFSGCNLRCEFCQNYKISHIGGGKEYSAQEFKEYLQSFDLTKFSSIDLITPTHFSSLLIEALKDFESPIPIVWNSSGYEKVEMIEKLSQVVDVFLPDFKYFSPELSFKYSKCKDYFDKTSQVILTMAKCKKENVFENGILTKGVLIRHLVLPSQQKDSLKVLDFISKNFKNPLVSVMGQFTPTRGQITRKLYPLEYKVVISYAEKLNLNGYFQELTSANENFIPEF